VIRATARSFARTHYLAGILEMGPAQAKLLSFSARPHWPPQTAAKPVEVAVASHRMRQVRAMSRGPAHYHCRDGVLENQLAPAVRSKTTEYCRRRRMRPSALLRNSADKW